jgi:hypothetical protein
VPGVIGLIRREQRNQRGGARIIGRAFGPIDPLRIRAQAFRHIPIMIDVHDPPAIIRVRVHAIVICSLPRTRNRGRAGDLLQRIAQRVAGTRAWARQP